MLAHGEQINSAVFLCVTSFISKMISSCWRKIYKTIIFCFQSFYHWTQAIQFMERRYQWHLFRTKLELISLAHVAWHSPPNEVKFDTHLSKNIVSFSNITVDIYSNYKISAYCIFIFHNRDQFNCLLLVGGINLYRRHKSLYKFLHIEYTGVNLYLRLSFVIDLLHLGWGHFGISS